MSIMEYNGSGIVAMSGKNCVAIASDMRFGIQQTTIADDMHRIFEMGDKLYVGISGLATDMLTVRNKLAFRKNMYELREDRKIRPRIFANMMSTFLYEHRFGPYFSEPIVCGLEDKKTVTKDGKVVEHKDVPFLCAMDLIGAPVETTDFVVAGTCSEQLYGLSEAMYRKNQEPDDLFETISQVLLAAVDRDCLAGWGAIVHIICPDRVISKTLKTRKD